MTRLDFFLTYGIDEGFITSDEAEFIGMRVNRPTGDGYDMTHRTALARDEDAPEVYHLEGGMDNFYLEVEADLDVR